MEIEAGRMETRKGKVIFLIYQNGRATNCPKPQFVTCVPQDFQFRAPGSQPNDLARRSKGGGRGGRRQIKVFEYLRLDLLPR